MKKIALLLFVLTGMIIAQSNVNYSPVFSGYIRAWHQTNFATSQGQFLIKQARLGINGKVNEYASYKFLVDFTRIGKLSTSTTTIGTEKVVTGVSASFSDILLDAAATISPIENFGITAGQFKVPFSTDNLSADQNADFVNRPMSTNVSPSMRDIGVMLSYSMKGNLTGEFSGGVFNGSGSNKSENDKSNDYGFRAVVSPVKHVTLSGNYYLSKSQGNDLNYMNFGLIFKHNQLLIDGEYTHKTAKTILADIKGNAYFIYALYKIPVSSNLLKEFIPAVRYEVYDPDASIDNNEVNRITVGATFEFAKINFARFRVNYELFDYKDGRDNPNLLVLEIQTRF